MLNNFHFENYEVKYKRKPKNSTNANEWREMDRDQSI